MTCRVVVFGAGPTGLALARQLVRRDDLDVEVTVVEANEAVGGLTASLSVGGVTFDHGSHRLHPSIDPAILADLRGLLGDELCERPRHGRLKVGGRFVRFPLRPLDALWRLPARLKLGILRDLFLRSLGRRSPDGDSYAAALEHRLGPAICEAVYFPFAGKLWGLPPDEISAEQARRRVSARGPGAILARVLSPRRRTRGFFYPAGGFGRIAEVLADDLLGRGGRIACSTRMTGLRHSEQGGWVVEAGPDDRWDADVVFSTIPVSVLVRCLAPSPPAPVSDAAGGLSSRGAVLVYLVLGIDRWTPFDAHYLPDAEIGFSRISEPKNYAGIGEPAGRTGLCIEVPASPGDSTWTADDADVVATVREQMAECGLPATEPLLESRVVRVPHVYPIYDLDYAGRLATIDTYLAGLPKLITLGRQGLFAHDNTHHALAMAWRAAECLGPGGRWDADGWERARRSFEEHVVED